MTQNYLIVSEKIWNAEMHLALNKLGIGVFSNISAKQNLNVDYLRIIKPRYIFFPHWSHIIPESIFNEFECVVFHMTDLPYGRGGSPLQNLILEGVEDTKISALINNDKRSLSIRVKSKNCKLLKLDRETFTRILGSIK